MKQVIGFFGGDSQVGTTMIAHSLAEYLAGQHLRVLLILGSGNFDGTSDSAGMGHSIDDLKASVRSGRVDQEELMQSLERKKELWILPGVRNPLTAKNFPENTYQVLLETAREHFDYIIIDGGCEYQLGMTISALNDSDCRFFVTTQQAKSLARYAMYREQILLPLELDGSLIVNKYVKDPALFLKSDILRFCGASEGFFVPYLEYGWQAEMEGVTLMSYRGFYRAIETLAGQIHQDSKRKRTWKKNFV